MPLVAPKILLNKVNALASCKICDHPSGGLDPEDCRDPLQYLKQRIG